MQVTKLIMLLIFLLSSTHLYALTDTKSQWRNYYNDIRNGRLLDEPQYTFPYEKCFRQSAKQHQIPLTVLLAVARGESDFNPKAGKDMKNHHAYGLMQLQWFDDRVNDTAKELGFKTKEALFKPCANIDAGARYLAWLLQQFDQDLYKAIAAYNVGIGNLKRGEKPQSAKWYSDYIYHHLEYVASLDAVVPVNPTVVNIVIAKAEATSRAKIKSVSAIKASRKQYKSSKKIPIIRFYDREKVERFIAFIDAQVKAEKKELELDWFKNSFGETFVVLLYRTAKQKNERLNLLKKIGYKPYVSFT